MNDVTAVTEFDWVGLIAMLKTTGVDFGINIVIALVIFYVGRIIARMLQKGIRRLMQTRRWTRYWRHSSPISRTGRS